MWNKKEPNIIICRVIHSHMGPMYVETVLNDFVSKEWRKIFFPLLSNVLWS